MLKTNSLKKYTILLDNIFWMIFDKIFLILLNLLVTVRVANHFGATIFGKYQYVINIVAILEIIITFVDGRITKKNYLNYPPETVVYSATVCRAFFSGVSFIIGLIVIVILRKDVEFSIMLAVQLLVSITDGLRFGMANRFEFLLKSKKVIFALDISRMLSGLGQLIAIKLGWGIKPRLLFIKRNDKRECAFGDCSFLCDYLCEMRFDHAWSINE